MLHTGRTTYVCLQCNLNFSDYYLTGGVSHLFLLSHLCEAAILPHRYRSTQPKIRKADANQREQLPVSALDFGRPPDLSVSKSSLIF